MFCHQIEGWKPGQVQIEALIRSNMTEASDSITDSLAHSIYVLDQHCSQANQASIRYYSSVCVSVEVC